MKEKIKKAYIAIEKKNRWEWTVYVIYEREGATFGELEKHEFATRKEANAYIAEIDKTYNARRFRKIRQTEEA